MPQDHQNDNRPGQGSGGAGGEHGNAPDREKDRPGPSPARRRGVPPGTVVMYAGDLDGRARTELKEEGWLPCDGGKYEVAEYRDLFLAIGTSHGGDGTNNFLVPDLRGTFVRGVDGGTGNDPDAAERTAPPSGGNRGDRVGSCQKDELAMHSHSAPHLPTTLHWAAHEAERLYVAQWNGDNTRTGDFGGRETRPKNVALHFIIRSRKD